MRDAREEPRVYVEDLESPYAEGEEETREPPAPERGVTVIWPPDDPATARAPRPC